MRMLCVCVFIHPACIRGEECGCCVCVCSYILHASEVKSVDAVCICVHTSEVKSADAVCVCVHTSEVKSADAVCVCVDTSCMYQR